MSGLFTFTKKELIEQWKNKKAISLLIVMLLFAITSPLLAKIMPDIMGSMMQEMGLPIPEVSFVDAYVQYYKNLQQIIMIMIILLYSGNVCAEISRNTIVLPLSKGLARPAFVTAKYLAVSIVWGIIYIVSSSVFYIYTQILFPNQAPQYLLLSFTCLFVFFLFLQAIVIFFSTVFNRSYGAMLGSGAVMVVLYIINIWPKTIKYSPLALSSKSIELISGNNSNILFPMILSILLIPIIIGAGILIFNKKEI